MGKKYESQLCSIIERIVPQSTTLKIQYWNRWHT